MAAESSPEVRSARRGYCCVAAAAVLWAASGTAAKFLFQSGISPFQLLQLRTTISAAALVGWLAYSRRAALRRSARIRRNDLLYFLSLGGALALAQFTYLFAISKIQVAAAILLQYQAPTMIALYTFLIVRQSLPPTVWAALIGSVAGCYLMVGGYSLDMANMNRAGIVSGLASAAAFAFYSLKSEYGMRSFTPLTVAAAALLVAAVIGNLLHPPFEAFLHAYGGEVWAGILFVGLFGTVIPFWLYSEGIKRLSAARAGITATLEPVAAGILSYFSLGELLEGGQTAGAALVVASLVLLQLGRQQQAS